MRRVSRAPACWACRMPPAQPGVTSATVNANTTINVHGVSDPLAVGNAVANEQNRVNSDLARNTRGAME